MEWNGRVREGNPRNRGTVNGRVREGNPRNRGTVNGRVQVSASGKVPVQAANLLLALTIRAARIAPSGRGKRVPPAVGRWPGLVLPEMSIVA